MDPVRFSRLKLMAKSPQHYLSQTVEETAAMERGTAVHTLLLGGPRLTFFPGPARRGKEWEAFEAANADAQILTRTDYDTANAMADSVRRNKLAMEVLAGRHEVELAWKFLGRDCGSKVDVIGGGGRWVTELKTARDAEPTRFMWQAIRMNYHAQLAFYQDAVEASGQGDPQDAFVVAVESSAPYVVTTLRLTDRALEQGRRLFRLWFERVLACEEAKAWPGYCESIVDLDVPEDEPELTFGAEDAA
jgi:hypothetical protein